MAPKEGPISKGEALKDSWWGGSASPWMAVPEWSRIPASSKGSSSMSGPRAIAATFSAIPEAAHSSLEALVSELPIETDGAGGSVVMEVAAEVYV